MLGLVLVNFDAESATSTARQYNNLSPLSYINEYIDRNNVGFKK